MYYLFLFHCDSGKENATQYYVDTCYASLLVLQTHTVTPITDTHSHTYYRHT